MLSSPGQGSTGQFSAVQCRAVKCSAVIFNKTLISTSVPSGQVYMRVGQPELQLSRLVKDIHKTMAKLLTLLVTTKLQNLEQVWDFGSNAFSKPYHSRQDRVLPLKNIRGLH